MLRRKLTRYLCMASAMLVSPIAFATDPQNLNLSTSELRADTSGFAPRVAAVNGFREFTQSLLQHETQGLPGGFPLAIQDLQDLRGAVIGHGFQVYEANAQSLLAGQRLGESVKASGIWRFIVQIAGKPAGLLTVDHIDGAWQLVSMGAIEGSRELAAVHAYHTAKGNKPLRLIRVPQASSDFLEVSSGGSVRFAPLLGAREALQRYAIESVQNLTSESLLNETDFMPSIRQSIQHNLAQ